MRRIVLAVLLGLLVGSCAGRRGDAKEPTGAAGDPLRLMPRNAMALVRIDIEKLRQSPYADQVSGWYHDLVKRSDELAGDTGLEQRVVEKVFNHAEHILGGAALPDAKGEPEEVVAVIRSDLGVADMKSWLHELPEIGDEVRDEQRKGRDVFVVDEMALVHLESGTWAITSTSRVDALIERAGSQAKGPRSELLRALYRRTAGGAALRIAFATPPQITEEIPADFVLGEDSKESLRAFGLRIAVSDGVETTSFLRADGAAAAKRIVEEANVATEKYRDNPFLILLGFDLLFEESKASADGNTAVLAAALDDTQTRMLLFHLDRLGRGVAGLLMGGGGMPGLLDGLGGDLGELAAKPSHEEGEDEASARAEPDEEIGEIAGDVERLRVPVTGERPQRGPDDALVTIVEFSDFQCPYCDKVQPTLDKLQDKYGDAIRIVWRNRPLPMHQNAPRAARAAMEAYEQGGDEAFWKMHDLLFDNQDALSRSDVEKYAEQIGLDMGAFRKALDGQEHAEGVEADSKLAKRVGATGTPTFLINGRLLRGAQPLQRFELVIDDEIERARELRKAGVPRDRLYTTLMQHAREQPAGEEGSKRGRTRKRPDPDAVYNVPLSGQEPVRGPDDALVTIVELGDFQCPFCKRVKPTLDKIRREYGDKVRIVWKNNPLPFHDEAMPAAIAALEAQQQKGDAAFWKMHDLIFEHQDKLGRDLLERVGKRLGLDAARLERALERKEHKERIGREQKLARSLGATGTPTFYINGRMVRGAQPFSKFETIIDEELNKAKEMLGDGVARSQLYEEIIQGGATETQYVEE